MSSRATTSAVKAKDTTAKQVQVIARVEFKNDPRKVVYFVRSSDGQSEYQTSLFEGKAISCNCPARKHCYHMQQCEEKEAGRVVIKVGETEISGVTASHAVEKALLVVKARRMVALSEECPLDVIEVSEECHSFTLPGDIDVTAFAPLPIEEEEYVDGIEEQWSEQEIAAIRKAAQITTFRPLPQAHKYENAPLNGQRGFSLLRV